MQIWKGHTWQLQKKWESKMQIEKMQIANGGKIERANATWKGAHLTNEEYMEGTNASGKEATSYVKNIDRWNATREKGKCQMQHTWKQKISLDKVVKPAQKTKETLNLKREVRGEPVKPKKNAQCWGSRLPSGQVTSRKGRSPIRIGDLQTKLDTFWKKSKKTEAKTKTKNTIKNKTKQQNNQKKTKNNGPSVGSSPGKWAPAFPKSRVWDLGWGAVPTNHQPFPENFCAHASVDAGTETQTELKLILAHIACEANSRTWMHENQATETAYPARPLNVNQVGVQKHVRQFAFLNLQHFICDLYLLCIAFFCICIFCAFMKRNYFFLHFLSAVVFCLFFKINFFCIACCIFQGSKFLR